MKKLMVFSLAVLMSSAVAQAQELGIGVKGGLNFANIDRSSSVGENYKNRTGYHFGAFALIKLSKIGIQPEVLFSKQGSHVTFNSQDVKQNYSYINIPIILKLYTIAGINIQVGPQFGFLSSAKEETTINNVKSTDDIKSELKSSDISAALGLGWDLPFGLSIDARYNLGLTKINDDSSQQATKNQVIQVSVGYKLFKIGG